MSNSNPLTQVLSAVEQGDSRAAEQLLALVYDELRKLATQRLARERPGQTLQATALVHEAYLRLLNAEQPQAWENRHHFFAAAAEAMRRILVENARRKKSLRRGGDLRRIDLDQVAETADREDDRLLALNEALESLSREDPRAAQLAKLRFFTGLSVTESADVLGISRAGAYEQWAYARAWLRCAVRGDEEEWRNSDQPPGCQDRRGREEE